MLNAATTTAIALSAGPNSDSELSENKFIDDGSYFEDDLDELGITVVKPTKLKSESGDQGTEGDIEESGLSEEEETKDIMAPTIESETIMTKLIDEIDGMTENLRRSDDVVDGVEPRDKKPLSDNSKRRRTQLDETALFNTSNRKSKNCATFYFKHHDTDSEADALPGTVGLDKSNENSLSEEWTSTSVQLDDSNVLTTCQMNNTKTWISTLEPCDSLKSHQQNNTTSHKKSKKSLFQDCSDEDGDGEHSRDRESLQKLIRGAEQLVREEDKSAEISRLIDLETKKKNSPIAGSNRTKYARIKEWLAINSGTYRDDKCVPQYHTLETSEMLDSCDASGEYTTGESDVEKQSEVSEDLESSVVTYRRADNYHGSFSQSNSEEILPGTEVVHENPIKPQVTQTSTPKVVLRSKNAKSNGPRPWSVSCISQIRNRANLDQNPESILQFSISETALHQLIPKTPVKSESLGIIESRVLFNNSSTTLLEETITSHDARVARNSSIRRRKNRIRKKNVGRRSESGSESLNANHRSDLSDGSSNLQRSTRKSTSSRLNRSSRDSQGSFNALVKSGSFSGRSVDHDKTNDKTLVPGQGSPQARMENRRSSNSSESDSEDDDVQVHKTREEAASAIGKQTPSPAQFNGDSDVEMNSLGNISFGEQATWDNYQEKYMSEAYSETQDVETARRLLEFGDDYRNFLDSQSEYASSLSAVQQKSYVSSEDSDSDLEFKRLTATSRTQLLISENHYGSSTPSSFNELARVCRENLRCLRAISEASGSRYKDKHSKQIRGLMERWESLSLRAEEAQKINNIHKEMSAMKLEFSAARDRIASCQVAFDESQVIEDRINKINSELSNLRERKPAMLALNVSTHRLITDLGQKTSPPFTALKEGVADLYRIWDEAFQKGNQQLCALQAVQQFSTRLSELQSALRRDKDTLAVLDAALKAGATVEVASSVRDVARLLSEKQDPHSQNDTLKSTSSLDDSDNMSQKFPEVSILGLEGGSLSDSGISDSGSEQELSERERRLAALRRLTRSLENQLEPDTGALNELWKRIEEAEAELRILQKQCRELIVRTAVCVESRSPVKSVGTNADFPVPSKRKVSLDSIPEKEEPHVCCSLAAQKSTSEPEVSRHWVWKVLRAALPFPLALVVLLCAACLLEPQCCDSGITLTFNPQLRYVRGPPPV